jgi:glutathione synthase/RimK-type ligase-like ATP-grasp enzyme
MIKILLITNKTDITTDFIVKKLTDKKVPFYRLNTEEIGHSVQISFDILAHDFILYDKRLNIKVDLLKFNSIYFRRPEIELDSASLTPAEANFIKSELLFTLEGLYSILSNAFWLNTVYSIRKAENKIYQLLLANKIGLNIPQSLITNNSQNAFDFYESSNAACIIKPIKSGLVESDKEEGVIFTSKIELTNTNITRIESCPIYLQELIEKKGDIRITVVGNKIFAAFIHSQDLSEAHVDWRRASTPLKHLPIDLPSNITNQCFELCRKLSLNFAAIDFILDKDNNYIFLEINPNGQWAWIEKQLNYPISEQITNLLIEKSHN